MSFLKTVAVLLLSAGPGLAQHAHGAHMAGKALGGTGQAQFASIAQIVEVLRNDPDTDWDRVDIQALRDHLVDMDNVTTRSRVATEDQGERVIFTITGKPDVAKSIQNMVTAHAGMLAAEMGWSVAVDLVEAGARMTLTPSNEAEHRQVLGLGFYGLMTIGAHHEHHHMMIALGRSPH